MTTDVSNPKQVKRRKKKATLASEQEREELKKLLDIPAFRRFYWRLLSECGVYTTSFTGNSTTFFNEGRRSIGLWGIEQIMVANPAAYGIMRVEAVEGDKKAEFDEEDEQMKEEQDNG